jgi:hypothetical protein
MQIADLFKNPKLNNKSKQYGFFGNIKVRFDWNRWKTIGLIIGIGIILLNSLVAVYLFTNILNWKIEPFNPPEKEETINYPILIFPKQNVDNRTLWGMGRNEIIFENLTVKYNGTLTEETPAVLSVAGTLIPEFAQEFSSVDVFYDGAVPYPITAGYLSGYGITLYPNFKDQEDNSVHLIGEPVTLSWQVQGDYYPSICIKYKNNITIIEKYDNNNNFCLHVDSDKVREDINTSRINISIAISGAILAIANPPSWVIVKALFSKKRRKR